MKHCREFLGILILLLICNPASAQEFTYLSDIEPVSAEARWFGFVKDYIYGKYPLILQGKEYKKGILTHAPAKIEYDLAGKYSLFTANIGLWDSGNRISRDIYNNNERDWRGPGNGVIYEIWCDGNKIYESGLVTWQRDAEIKIIVTGAHLLTLYVTENGDTDSDWAVWADAKLHY
ncbi:hypothetical protein MASR2M29_02840 [Spirochaetota bacterium]